MTGLLIWLDLAASGQNPPDPAISEFRRIPTIQISQKDDKGETTEIAGERK